MVTTVTELLRQRAEGDRRDWDIRILYAGADAPPGYSTEGRDQSLLLRYADLWELAGRAAFGLASRGVSAGDRVLLLLPTAASFLAVFFGCQLLGAVPVPLVPPWSRDRRQGHAERVARVARICQASVAVTETRFLPPLAECGLSLLLGQELLASTESWSQSAARADAPAFIQFTSGSTSEPRGVVVEHSAVLANGRFITGAIELGADDVVCSWLPLFHDMGLIGHLLVPIATGSRLVLMPPEAFMLQPRAWLQAITDYRASVSTAPNYAYNLCAQKIAERDLSSLQLGAWRVAMCGGETVQPGTLERFVARFSGCGFDAASLRPVYGLAESTLAVTVPPRRPAPRTDSIDRDLLQQTGRALPAVADAASAELVSVGFADAAAELRVTGPGGEACGERQVGQIEIRGPSVMKEYFRNESATREVLEAGWLRTGDLGYLAGGELFVTGRAKEVVIKAGRNMYPYDIEAAAEGARGVRSGRSAAFGVPNPDTGTEDLVIVCETRLKDAEPRQQLLREILSCVFAATGLRPDAAYLAPPRSLNRTSSGKVQRTLVRSRFLSGELDLGQPQGGGKAS